MIINEIRTFTKLLSTDLTTDRLLPEYRLGTAIFKRIGDPHDFNNRRFLAINRKVFTNDWHSCPQEKTKNIWLLFVAAYLTRDIPQLEATGRALEAAIGEIPLVEEFESTDLIVTDTNLPFKPLNVVTLAEFNHINQLYKKFTAKICFELKELEPLITQDIRMILSRPVGRLLIEEILKKLNSALTIRLGSGFAYNLSNKGTHTIDYSLNRMYHYYLTEHGLVSSKTVNFIKLAHELVHLLHALNKEFDHFINPKMNPLLDTEEEELRTIYGMKCCELHEESPVSENQLLKEFNLPIRLFHYGTPELPDRDLSRLQGRYSQKSERSVSAPPTLEPTKKASPPSEEPAPMQIDSKDEVTPTSQMDL